METNTKENGEIIKDMEKELYGEKIIKENLLESIQVNGNMTKNGDQELCILIIVIDMMVVGKMIK